MAKRKPGGPSGVLVVDKPRGPTSHDVVAMARRKLGTRAVGHAGTLDPMATGVLVLAIGRATKLVPWLTADDKAYEAVLRLGVATDSLDADGTVVDQQSVPGLSAETLQHAAQTFVGPHVQRPPRVSAIRVDGKRMHERVRAGEDIEAPMRDVVLHEVHVSGYDAPDVQLSLRSAKGFYVRSFGRDLAAEVKTIGHLVALRRTASGRFTLEDAVHVEAIASGSLLGLTEAVSRLMPLVRANEEGAIDAGHGRRIKATGLLDEMPNGRAALTFEDGLLAVVEREGDSLKILRGGFSG